MAHVSVIIPLYNKKPYIQRALDSVLGQTFHDIELIVVNDGSTDGGEAIIASCPDSRVRLIHQTNAGPGSARNHGISLAQSPLVAFLDADDAWLPTYLEKSVALLEKHLPEVATVSSGYFLHPANVSMSSMWRMRHLNDGVYRVEPNMAPLFVVHLLAFLTPPSTVIRTTVVRQWGGFFSQDRCLYGEDSYFWLKVLLNAPVLVNLEPLLHIHTEASDLSKHRGRARPIEPLLTHPEGLHEACPEHLRELLRKVLAIRAIKTACMLGYWGHWQEARRLLHRFCQWSDWRLHRFWLAYFAATPVGATSARIWRMLSRMNTES